MTYRRGSSTKAAQRMPTKEGQALLCGNECPDRALITPADEMVAA